MLFAEQPTRWRGWTIEIIGTDVSRAAVERAREGNYSQFEIQRGLPVMQMVSWFEERGGTGAIAEALRKMVRFEAHNLLEPPPAAGPFRPHPVPQRAALFRARHARGCAFARLASALAPDGALMLGAGETVIGQTERFVSDPECRGLYLPAPRARAANGQAPTSPDAA